MIRKIFKYWFLILNVLFAFTLIICRVIPAINPFEQRFVGILAYLVPFLTVFNILFILLWVVVKRYYYALIPLVSILISWKVISVLIGGHILPSNPVDHKNKETLSILSYNIRLLDLYGWSGKKETRSQILAFLKTRNADILCLQEYYTGNDSVGFNNTGDIKSICNYPYVAECIMNENKRGKWGSVLFSKFPIVSKKNHDIDVSGSNLLQEVRLKRNGDTLTVFNFHLKSNKFSEKESALVANSDLPDVDEKTLNKTKSIYQKIERSTQNRGLEADLVSRIIGASKYATLVCGDMNDIPGSYSYFKIRSKHKDLFLSKGFGLGATYNKSIPVLRIDYIFYDPIFKPLFYETIPQNFSDHNPIYGEFALDSNYKAIIN